MTKKKAVAKPAGALEAVPGVLAPVGPASAGGGESPTVRGRREYQKNLSEVLVKLGRGELSTLSILEEMHVAYGAPAPGGARETVGVRRWRKLFTARPDKFMAVLEKQEAKAAERAKGARAAAAERERLAARVAELEGELRGATGEVARLAAEVGRLEGLLGGSGDPYADPGVGRVGELGRRLLGEYGSKGGGG